MMASLLTIWRFSAGTQFLFHCSVWILVSQHLCNWIWGAYSRSFYWWYRWFSSPAQYSSPSFPSTTCPQTANHRWLNGCFYRHELHHRGRVSPWTRHPQLGLPVVDHALWSIEWYVLMLKVRNGPRGFEDGEQVAAVYPFALVQGVVDCAGCYYRLGWVSCQVGCRSGCLFWCFCLLRPEPLKPSRWSGLEAW